MEHRQFAQRLVAVFDEGRGQRPRIAQFAGQQRDPRVFAQREIGGAGRRGIQQLGNGAFVHGGILPHVETGEMKAETIHRPAQQPQPAARDHAGIIRDQRAVEHVEIGLELLHAGIGRGFADRRPGGFHLQPQCRRGEPGIDAGYRQPIRLAASMRRRIGRTCRQRAQFFRDVGQMRGQRKLGAERMQFLEIKSHDAAALQPQRAAHHIGGDEGIAVAIAADPASHPQERRQPAIGAVFLAQPIFQCAMQPRHLVQEGVVVERKPVGDFVEHGELGPAQQIGLPQGHHRAAQLLVAGRDFIRRELDPFAPVQQCRDLHLAVDGALAAHFGRMRC